MFGNRAQMQSMMKKARKMQEEMKKLQDEIKQKTVDVTVGGGAVSVIMNGDKQITSLTISKDAIDPNDAEMLEDLNERRYRNYCGTISSISGYWGKKCSTSCLFPIGTSARRSGFIYYHHSICSYQ